MAETELALETKLAGMPQDVLDWCGDALFAGTPEQTIEFYQDLVEAGFQYFIANILDGDYETIELMGKHLIPAFQ
jgi:alkanesulfonate monooxygenase SsuD/methylene tetrahydromethanopterin reductase-like flavin-dependent oxidoreductase (luciferase family)